MNPRIQVEHTVTEEVTDVDLVQSQLRIAAGETLADLGLSQDSVRLRGAALQCRITTEDPANDFRPDTGKITTYRSPGGPGVRLDGGTTYNGAEVSPHFDSMLAKLTCRGRTFDEAVQKAQRAVAEFRIRGVRTNLGFLQAVLRDPDFTARRRHHLVHRDPPAAAGRAASRVDQGGQLLRYLAEITVNQPYGEPPVTLDPVDQAAAAVAGGAGARRHPAALLRARPRGVRPPAAGAEARSRSPTPPSATPTRACSPPGCARSTCSAPPATSPG